MPSLRSANPISPSIRACRSTSAGEELSDLLLPDFIQVAARLHADQLALRFGAHTWTHRDVGRAVTRMAGALGGLPPGRLGILAGIAPDTIFAIHAAVRRGIPIVPLNWRLPAAELRWQIDAAEVSTLLVDAEHEALAREAAAGTSIEILALFDMQTRSNETDIEAAATISLDQEAAVLFTSGTTGRAKGARLTVGNLWYSAVASTLHLGHVSSDRWLATLPLYHIGGLSILFRAAITGAAIDLHTGFDASAASVAIDNGATLVSLVPTTLQRVLDLRQGQPFPATLRAILLGGAPASAALLQRCLTEQIPICPTYGLTESASQATTLLTSELAARIGSSGQALPLTEIRITQDDGPTPPGEIGSVELRGPTIFAGYLGETEDNLRDANGWFATGDAGYLDEDGFLYVVDRRTDLIVSGGENIYPAVVERVLLEHPDVCDAAVFGVADATWGSRPIAAVVMSAGIAFLEDTLHDHCAARLARFMIPDQFHLVAALPRSASGKLLRRALPRAISQGRVAESN